MSGRASGSAEFSVGLMNEAASPGKCPHCGHNQYCADAPELDALSSIAATVSKMLDARDAAVVRAEKAERALEETQAAFLVAATRADCTARDLKLLRIISDAHASSRDDARRLAGEMAWALEHDWQPTNWRRLVDAVPKEWRP